MSDVDVMQIALASFNIAAWCNKHGFTSTKYGEECVHDCPWCNAEGKLSVNPVLRKWRCFKCQRRFTLLDLVAEYEGAYYKAIEIILSGGIANRRLDHIPDEEWGRRLNQRSTSWEPAPIDPPPYFRPLVEHHPYTAGRGMNLDYLRVVGAGVCTDGFYQDRLVFPCRRPDGAWLYFQSRATWEAHEHHEGSKYRKNLNPKTEDPAIWATAQDVLLGVELLKPYGLTRAAVVEGPTDWVAVGPGAVATFGKTISDRQIALLVRAGVAEVDLMWDPDAWTPDDNRPAPAQRAAERLAGVFQLRVVHYPPGVDAGDFSAEDNARWRGAAEPFGASRLGRIREGIWRGSGRD